MPKTAARLRLRLVLGDGSAFGPGKADLLALIGTTGSISAAGRAMGMSYKKAWHLVDDMNRAFREPLVEAAKGGKAGGGAKLTAEGEAALARYREMEEKAADLLRGELAAFGKRTASR